MPQPRRQAIVQVAAAIAAIALGAPGCFSDRGVAIQVDVTGTTASLVELYLGQTDCVASDKPASIDCSGIGPPSSGLLEGTVRFRDAAARYTATVANQRATFRLEAEVPTSLPIVIAVGFDRDQNPVGTATLTALDIPVHSARVVTTALVPAGKIASTAGIDTRKLNEDRVAVWAQSHAESACVAVEHWRNAAKPTRDFIVPIGDPDCDEVAAPECAPAVYHGARLTGGSDGEYSCTVATPTACALSGPGCSDDGGSQACLPPSANPACVPMALCECDHLDRACIESHFGSTMPYLHCEVPMTLQGEACPSPRDATQIDLGNKFPSSSCGREPLITGLLSGAFGNSFAFGGAVLEVGSANAPCNFELKWTEGTRLAGELKDHGAIKLTTRIGAVVLPLELSFSVGCGAGLTCTPMDAPDQTMWSCAR
jgi:hypothetical protein